PRPHRQPAHAVVVGGPDPARVVVGEELGLVGGHVHPHRAVVLAALAGQAEVEGVVDGGGVPAVGDRGVGVAVQHLEQQPGAPAGGVLLLAGGPVGGAHDAALVAAALADADAAHHGPLEAALVVGVAELGLGVSARPRAAQPQVRGDAVRCDDLSGV